MPLKDIQNQKDMWSEAIPPAFDEKSPVNFGPLTTECVTLDPLKWTFLGNYIFVLWSAVPSNFYMC